MSTPTSTNESRSSILLMAAVLSLGAIPLLILSPILAAVYPSAVATDADLLVARNGMTTNPTLATSINNSITTIVLSSGTGFGSNQMIVIQSERIFCATLTTATYTGCTRAYDGSTAASHTSGVPVRGDVIGAKHHNALSAELQALETALGPNLANAGLSSVKKDGSVIISSAKIINLATGTGIFNTVTDVGSGQVNVQSDTDFTKIQFNPTCTETSASSTVYTCAPTFTPANYSAVKGYPFNLTFTHAGAGGATTLKLDGVTGTKSLKQCDGTTNPTVAQTAIGRTIHPNYDATLDVFKMDGDCPTAAASNPYIVCSRGEQATSNPTGAYANLTVATCTLPTLAAGDAIQIVTTINKAGTAGATCQVGVFFETYALYDEANVGSLYTFPAVASSTIIKGFVGMATTTQAYMSFEQVTPSVAAFGHAHDVAGIPRTGMTVGSSPVISVQGRNCTGGDTLRIELLTVTIHRAV